MPFLFPPLFRETDVKAVQQKDKSTYGLIQIVAQEDSTRLFKICGVFETDRQRRQFYFYDKSLFFYGTEPDLRRNYRRPLPFTNLEDYLDRDAESRVSILGEKVRSSPSKWDKYYAIPVKALGLAPHQVSMLEDRVIPQLREVFPQILETMEEYALTRNNLALIRAANCSFKGYPTAFRDDAAEQQKYYMTLRRSKLRRKIVTFPRPQRSAKPLDTIPEWVRGYLKLKVRPELKTVRM